MAEFRPIYITFDCYGTLIHFQMSDMTRTMFADRLTPDRLQAFTTDFSAYRFDEVLGPWQPYADVIKQALRRACHRWGVPYREADAQHMYEAIPTWGPHPDRSPATWPHSARRSMPSTRPSRRRPINPASGRLST
jgi:2-haloacid dehalogenase